MPRFYTFEQKSEPRHDRRSSSLVRVADRLRLSFTKPQHKLSGYLIPYPCRQKCNSSHEVLAYRQTWLTCVIMSMRKRRSGAKAAAIDLDHEHQQKPFTQRATVGSTMNWIRRQPVWIVLAIASGACAAINGVFAKLYDNSIATHSHG